MNANNRRAILLCVLKLRRMDTYSNLATELHVSKKTVIRDVEMISCEIPIESIRGCKGGIRLALGYNHDQLRLNAEQLQLLIKLAQVFQGEELQIINSIIYQLSC